MSIAKDLEGQYILLADIIQELPKEFNSHDFIKKVNAKMEGIYVRWLASYPKANGQHQTVHAQISGYLSRHQKDFGIRKKDDKGGKRGKENSENVKGSISRRIQIWEK